MVIPKASFVVSILLLLLLSGVTRGFVTVSRSASKSFNPLHLSTDNAAERSELENALAQNYPGFYNFLVQPSEDVVKTLRKNYGVGFTIFCPNDAAFEALGEQKCSQLGDPRNLETVEKMAAFHIIGDETVLAETLASDSVGGVMTMGGAVDVGPSQSGGFFGIGAKNDGGTAIGPGARIVASYQVGAGVVHEVDSLISPSILWRYMDQLRIPGIQK